MIKTLIVLSLSLLGGGMMAVALLGGETPTGDFDWLLFACLLCIWTLAGLVDDHRRAPDRGQT